MIAPVVSEHPTGGGQLVVVESQGGVTINANYENLQIEMILMELLQRRANVGIHMITFEDVIFRRLVNLNVYMPKLSSNSVGYDSDGCRIAYSAFSLAFKQVNLVVNPVVFEFWNHGTIATGGAFGAYRYKIVSPVAGLVTGISGSIGNVGTGTTNFSVLNERSGQHFLWTFATFTVAGAGVLTGVVLNNETARRIFKGDVLSLVAYTTPGDSSNACIQVKADVFWP